MDIKELSQRQEYLDSVEGYIGRLSEKSQGLRDNLIGKGKDELRKTLKRMLGAPLDSMSAVSSGIACKKELLIRTDAFEAWRCQLEVMKDFWLYGILYLPVEQSGTNALVIAQHGGGGTPEIVGSLVLNSGNYNHMVNRIIRKGVVVFAPQLLSWNQELYEPSQYTREHINRRLIQLGGSLTSLEVYCITRVIDYFSQVDYIDPHRIGMAGLSYGGMYTLYAAAIDERIRAAYSSCWFSDRTKHNWHDWVYYNQQNTLMDAEVASLILPRKLYIEVAENDEVFPAKDAAIELDRLRGIAHYQKCEHALAVKVFQGGHELDKDNEMLEDFVKTVLEG